MQEHSANPYWRLKAKEIKRYTPKSLDEEAEVAAHKQRIALKKSALPKRFMEKPNDLTLSPSKLSGYSNARNRLSDRQSRQ
jgi:hypothetical protein